MPGQMPEYEDFVLKIERAGEGRYRAEADGSIGQAETTFTLPFDEKDLQIFLLKVGRPRQGASRGIPQPMQEMTDFGRSLYDAVFSGGVRDLLVKARYEMEQRGCGLRIKLRLSAAPELASLPWEFLCDGRDYLALNPDLPIVRHLDLPQPPRPLHVDLPLRILVTISAPDTLPPLLVDVERKKISTALESLTTAGLVDLTFTPDALISTLQRTLRRANQQGKPFHVWHFIGHGAFDEQTQSSVLALCDEHNRAHMVNGFTLGTLFAGYRDTRLVVMNACEGARPDPDDPFAGVAAALVERGIPAVVGMQFEITDKAALTFAEEFYKALVDGLCVEAALTEARRAIFFLPNHLEWATPVLFMRVADGQLFDVSYDPARIQAEAAKQASRGGALQQQAEPLRADVAADSGEPVEAERLYREAQADFEALGDRQQAAVMKGKRADLAVKRGDWGSAEGLYREALRDLQTLGDRREIALMTAKLADLMARRGDWPTAEHLYREALASFETLGDRQQIAAIKGKLADIAARLQRWDEAERLRREEMREYEALGDRHQAAVSKGKLADIAAKPHALEETEQPAHEELQQQIERVQEEPPPPSREQWEEAKQAAYERIRRYEAGGDRYQAAYTMAELADLAMQLRKWDEAEQFTRQALAIFEEEGEEGDAAAMRERLAALETHREGREEAMQGVPAAEAYEEGVEEEDELDESSAALLRRTALAALIEEWLALPDQDTAQQFLVEHESTLLSDEALAAIDMMLIFKPGDEMLTSVQELIHSCREVGIEQAFANLPEEEPEGPSPLQALADRLIEWCSAEDWETSRALLKAHEAELLSDEALTALQAMVAAGEEAEAEREEGAVDYVALLRACREMGIDAAYDAFLGSAQEEDEEPDLSALLATADVMALIEQWLAAPNDRAARQFLKQHEAALLSDRGEEALNVKLMLNPGSETLQAQRNLLRACREMGIDKAYKRAR
ncbi:MAG: hypothetical protein Kow00124_16830 [Anaerolineae bacterium]